MYEMKGLGHKILKQSFDFINKQTFKEFEVVVSDHSSDDLIRDLCFCENRFPVKHIRNIADKGSSSANINNAMSNATGDIIKILFQDDLIVCPELLKNIHECFQHTNIQWVVSPCFHSDLPMSSYWNPIMPRYNENIHKGVNTISSPSVLSVRNNEDLPKFDNRLIWLMDVDYYKSLYDLYGLPTVIGNANSVLNRMWPGQVSSNGTVDKLLVDKENSIITSKYK